MARNKRKRIVIFPKKIRIDDNNGEFKLYKTWSNKAESKDPFYITDSLEEVIEAYHEHCKKWSVTPEMELIYKLISKHQQAKEEHNEEPGIFKSLYT